MSPIPVFIWTTGCLIIALVGFACVIVGCWPVFDKIRSRFKREG